MTSEHLKQILDTVRKQPDLQPVKNDEGEVVKTFCNIGLDRILKLCDKPRMINRVSGQPLMANDMIECMEHSPSLWSEVNGEVACARASQGVLVVACQKADGHGHVCCVYPMTEEFSSSWGKPVPMVSNIGKTVGVMRVSQAFRTEPKYYSVHI